MITLKRQFDIEWNDKKLIVEQTKYYNGRYALQAFDKEGFPYATLTTNITAYDKDFPDPKTIFIDTNNCPGIKDVLSDANLIEDTGYRVQSGYYMYPVVRWKR